nr:hypothetical protein CFP56_42860 [Quercus suber]
MEYKSLGNVTRQIKKVKELLWKVEEEAVRTGDIQEKDEEVFSNLFIDYYTRLFTSSSPRELDRVLEGVQEVVTGEMNASLMMEYKPEEVVVAIKEMAPLKALGPDGMPPLFYQSYWPDVGTEVT